jgi:hypothetical protein
VLEAPYNQKTPSGFMFFIGFAVAYATIWWKAIPGLKAVEKGTSWAEMLAFTWLVVLVVFQLMWLIIMLIMLAPAFPCDPT